MPDIKSLKKAMELLQNHLDSYISEESAEGEPHGDGKEKDGKVDGEYSDASEYHGKDEFADHSDLESSDDSEGPVDEEYSKKPLRQKRVGMF